LVSCSLRNGSSLFCCPIVVRQTENRQPLDFLFQLPNPFLQELPFRFLLGQGQGFLIRGPSLSGPAEPAAQLCTSGMRQVIICQFAMFQQRVDVRQTSRWTIALGNCHGAIEMDNRRRLNSYQSVVKRNNLPPVGGSGRFRLRMNGGNCSLQCVRAEAAGHQGFLHQCHSLRDLRAVPKRAVLILQQNQLSFPRGSRNATGFLQQHERKQPRTSGSGWSSVSSRPNRIASPVSSARVTSAPAAAE